MWNTIFQQFRFQNENQRQLLPQKAILGGISGARLCFYTSGKLKALPRLLDVPHPASLRRCHACRFFITSGKRGCACRR
jgi:hypothetical protein